MKPSICVLCSIVFALVPLCASAQCLAMGTYRSQPPLSYSCAFGEIDWLAVDWHFEDLGFGEIGVTAYPGPLPYLTGAIDCNGYTFEVLGEGFGDCLQGYVLSGQIISYTQWIGNLQAGFTGICYDCTSQSWPVSGSIGTAVPEGDRTLTWSTIKGLYR